MPNVLAAVAALFSLALLLPKVLAGPIQAASVKCPCPQIEYIAIHSPLFFRDSEDQNTWAGDGLDETTENAVATVYLTGAPEGDNDLAGSSANHLRLKPATLHNDLAKRSPQHIPTPWEAGHFVLCAFPRRVHQYLVKKAYDYCGSWLGLSISIKRDDGLGVLILNDVALHPELWTARYEPVRQRVGMNVVAVVQYFEEDLRHIEIYDVQTARSVMAHPQVEFENPEEVLFHISVTHERQGAK